MRLNFRRSDGGIFVLNLGGIAAWVAFGVGIVRKDIWLAGAAAFYLTLCLAEQIGNK